jgi:hypothetical protein
MFHQDWGTPWVALEATGDTAEIMKEFANEVLYLDSL